MNIKSRYRYFRASFDVVKDTNRVPTSIPNNQTGVAITMQSVTHTTSASTGSRKASGTYERRTALPGRFTSASGAQVNQSVLPEQLRSVSSPTGRPTHTVVPTAKDEAPQD
jgi:hypothetical protein